MPPLATVVGKKLHSAGASHASGLIGSGKIKDSASWSAPSADQENEYLKTHSNSELGDWYLGEDPDADKETKGRWAFPFTSDFKEVDLSGLKACINRAAQSGYDDIETRARSLYQAAKKKLGKDDDASDSFMPKRNPKAVHWLRVRNVLNQDGEEATEMVISGIIGSSWYDSSGATSKEFRESLDAIPKGKKVHVRINSEGGSVQDALEIYNRIQQRKEDVTTFNDGYALSSASVILCAGGRSIAPHSSLTMIHEPWSMTMGDESDHLKAAEMLAKHGDTIAGIYARKTGKTAAEMREMMKAESWFTGAEACQNRLADAMADDAECPGCGHEQCEQCQVDGDNITCSECGEENPAEEWEETPEEEAIEDRTRRFAALDLKPYQHIPNHIFNMLRPKAVRGQNHNNPAARSRNTTTDKMNKKAILDLLKKHGAEIADDASDDVILAALAKLGETPATANGDSETVKALQKQLQDEKRIRISAEVKRRGENRIKNDKLNWWIDLAMKDETTTFDQIDSLPVQRPGGDPLATEISTVENRLDEIRKNTGARNAGKRFNMLKDEWDGLIQDALARDSRMGLVVAMPTRRPDGSQGASRMYPVNANTYSASLVTQFLMDGAVTKLQNRWAPLRVFSRDYSMDRYKPRATGQLKFVTAGSTNGKNLSNFESGDSTVTNVQIGVDQYSQPFHVTNDELNSGLRMENLVDVNVAALADTILQVSFSPLNLADFSTDGTGPNAKIVRAPAAFSWSDLMTGWGELKKSPIKYAVLDGEYMARIANQPTFYQRTGTQSGEEEGWRAFGWDGIWLNTNWTGTHALAGDQFIRGLICNPQALGAIAGLPLVPPSIPGNTLMESSMTVPDVDISIAAYQWFSLSTRTFWMSYDLMFGSAKLDVSAGVLITSQ